MGNPVVYIQGYHPYMPAVFTRGGYLPMVYREAYIGGIYTLPTLGGI